MRTSPNQLRAWEQTERRGIVWDGDGVESSVALVAEENGYAFIVNGKSDGSAIAEGAWPNENGAHSIGTKFVDSLVVSVRCIKIAHAIQSQAKAARVRNGAEQRARSIRCKFVDIAYITNGI